MSEQSEQSQSQLKDMELECKDCGDQFTFSAGEQEFFADKFGKDYNIPKRCKPCRAVKKSGGSGGGDRQQNQRY